MLERIHQGVDITLFWLAGIALIVMMALVSIDVVARYLFNAPLTFQFELTTNYLMVMVATLGLPWCLRRGAFIKLSVLGRFLGVRSHNLLHVFNALVAAAVLVAIAWFSGVRTWDKFVGGDAMFGVIDWPVWLSTIWVPIGCAMLALRLVTDALLRLRNLDRPVDGDDERTQDARDIAENGGAS